MRADGSFRFSVVCSDPPADDRWAERVRRFGDLGYGGVLLTDHVDGQYAVGPAIAAALHVDPRMRFGSLVYCNDLYQPVMLAREAMTLAHLSGGRFDLGIGAGWDTRDYARAGVPFDAAGTRIGRLAETVRIVRRCFAGQPFTYHSDRYRIDADVSPLPPVPESGPPPLLLGGGSPRILRLAGEYADLVSINPSLRSRTLPASALAATNDAAGTTRRLGWVREGAGERFDGIGLSVTVYIAVQGEDRDRIARHLARRAGVTADQVLGNPHVLVGTRQDMVDTLCRRRDRWGFASVVIDEAVAYSLAPVVQALTGR